MKVEGRRGAAYPGEERVEAVDLLPLGDVGVVLSDALQREFLHQVDLVGFLQVLGLQHKGRAQPLTSTFWLQPLPRLLRLAHHELLHTDGEGGRVEQDLPVLGQEADDVLDEHHKVLRQKLICLRRNKPEALRAAAEGRFTKAPVLSTSSITMICTLSTFATPFFIRSRIRPGVAMTTCTDGRKRHHECTQKAEDGGPSARRSYQSHPDA